MATTYTGVSSNNIFKIGFNNATLADSPFSNSLNVTKLEYTSFKYGFSLLAGYTEAARIRPLIAFDFVIDDEVMINERSAYTILNVL